MERINLKKQMNKKKLGLLIIAAIMLQACGNQTPQNNQDASAEPAVSAEQPAPIPPLDGQWKADYIKGVTLIENTQSIYLNIDLNKKTISGSDSCNLLTAPIVTLTDKELSFGEIASTLRYCPEIEYQEAFQTALRELASYKLAGEHLHLFDKQGEKLLILDKGKRQ